MTFTTCSLCGIKLTEYSVQKHTGSLRCNAGQITNAYYAKGLRPVELQWQAKSDHVALALRMFGHTVELLPTRARVKAQAYDRQLHQQRSGPGNEAWTDPEGVALALLIEHAAKLLATSYPEAARRLHERPDLVGPFGAARLLDTDDGTLLQMLQPIDWIVGSDGKRRPRGPVA